VRQSYSAIFCEKFCLGIWNVKKGLYIKVIKAPFYIGESFWKVEQYGWIISAGLCLSFPPKRNLCDDLKWEKNKHVKGNINPLNAELNPICHLLAFLGVNHIRHVSRVRVKGVCSWLLLCVCGPPVIPIYLTLALWPEIWTALY